MVKKVVLSIDIGGTYTKVGLVTNKGEIINKVVFKTEAQKPFSNFMGKLKLEVKTLVLRSTLDIQILHIGVGAPNANPNNGNIENPPNLKWGLATPIKKIMEQAFELPVVLANDANAAALGEMLYGA